MLVSLALEKAVERAGSAPSRPATRSDAFATALAAGPGRARRRAPDGARRRQGRPRRRGRDRPGPGRRPRRPGRPTGAPTRWSRPSRPPTAGSSSPPRGPWSRSTRAARSPARAGSCRSSPGSSPTRPPPKAVVIDGNVNRASQLAGFLKELGYDPQVADDRATDGFRLAAESADVELILIDPHFVQGHWRLVDTLANLRADARTAAIPIFVVGPPEPAASSSTTSSTSFPGVEFLVTPTDAHASWSGSSAGRPAGRCPTPSGRVVRPRGGGAAGRDRLAAGEPVRGRPGRRRAGPGDRPELAGDRPRPPRRPWATCPAPTPSAGLADVVLDPSQPAPLRLAAAAPARPEHPAVRPAARRRPGGAAGRRAGRRRPTPPCGPRWPRPSAPSGPRPRRPAAGSRLRTARPPTPGRRRPAARPSGRDLAPAADSEPPSPAPVAARTGRADRDRRSESRPRIPPTSIRPRPRSAQRSARAGDDR